MTLHRQDYAGLPESAEAAASYAHGAARRAFGRDAAEVAERLVRALAIDALTRTPPDATFILTTEFGLRQMRFEILDPALPVEGRVPGPELAEISRLAHFSRVKDLLDGEGHLTWAVVLIDTAPEMCGGSAAPLPPVRDEARS
ncbi:hypothetical protein [Acrocarpospora macrocephala]|nr:hypothetical protein [Acrocarpospora macrocephala]